MRQTSLILLGVFVVGLLFLNMITYQVGFNELALITTFGRAEEGSAKNVDGASSGLYWKWPWPIQQVRIYDSRLRILEDRLEQQETEDKQVVIVEAYVTWRIVEPLHFYRSLQNERNAERILKDRLRTARAEIGRFTFDELTTVDPGRQRLSEAEQRILDRMKAELAGQDWGVTVESVGIKRLLLPKQITKTVFERMRQTRKRLAQNARSEGEAIARRVRAKARSDAERILAFAERKAQEIRSEGDAAAAEYYRVFAQNEDFAVFIRKLEALRAILSHNTTFLLDTKSAPFDMLKALGDLGGTPKEPEEGDR